ncbi:MAG: T9SS type A sorting domain-containing protein [bacterium]|nr:T9SS type A sorting domain-containing protein [bacterium]
MRRQIMSVIAALVLLAIPAFSQGWNVELVGTEYRKWIFTDVITCQGNYAFLGIGGSWTTTDGVAIVDVSEATDPMEVAIFNTEDYTVKDIEVAGNYAYIGSWGAGLSIVNVTNPSNPIEVSQAGTIRYVNDLSLGGDYAYVSHLILGTGNRLAILDVSNPALPITLCQYSPPNGIGRLTVSGPHVYAAAVGGMSVIDVSNPVQPAAIGFLNIAGTIYDIEVLGGMVYITEASGLDIIDISHPIAPVLLGHLGYQGVSSSIEVSGNLVYISNQGNGLRIADVSQPSNPVIIGSLGINQNLREISLVGTHVYGACEFSGLAVFDVSIPQNPALLCNYSPDWTMRDVAYQDGYTYIAASGDGLLIQDVSDPQNPIQVSYLDDIGNSDHVTVMDNYAYLQSNTSSVQVVDVTNPIHPSLTGSFDPQAIILKILDGLAYLGGERIFKILDMSSPTNPVQIGLYTLPPYGGISYLDTDGRFLYAIVTFSGNNMSSFDSLLVLDVNNPTDPQYLSSYFLGDSYAYGIHHLALGDGYLYVTGDEHMLRIFDISDPTQLVQLSQQAFPIDPSELAVEGDYLYIGNEGSQVSGPRIFDVSDPLHPELVGYYMAPAGYYQQIAVHDNLVYNTEHNSLYIYDCSDATHNALGITITPLTLPVVIPASGGSFDFYLFAQNSGPGLQSTDLWTKVIYPNGVIKSPVLGPSSASLDTGSTGWLRHQNVPGIAPAGTYTYITQAGNYPNGVWASDTLYFVKLATGNGIMVGDWNCSENPSTEITATPGEFKLSGASPNPFNPTTTLTFTLPYPAKVSLEVFDINGRVVRAQHAAPLQAGEHIIVFDGSELASGVYLYRFSAGNATMTGKMVLMK